MIKVIVLVEFTVPKPNAGADPSVLNSGAVMTEVCETGVPLTYKPNILELPQTSHMFY